MDVIVIVHVAEREGGQCFGVELPLLWLVRIEIPTKKLMVS